MQNQMLFSIACAVGLSVFSASALSATLFGSKLNHEPTPAETCKANKPGEMCSWVLTIGQQNVGNEPAPKDGTVVKLRLRSCSPGSFVLQMVEAFPGTSQARALRTGPAINYKGNPLNCEGGTFIETFAVNVPVFKGEYLAVIATKVGFIYNSSGDGSLVYNPLLADGKPLRTTTGTGLGSGILLLQAVYND
jgi:hypothetical protein